MITTDILGSPLDPLALDIRADPYPRYHALRAAAPVTRGTHGVWLASSFSACDTVLRDPRFGHLEPDEEPVNPQFGRLGDDGDPLREPDGTPVHSFIVLNPPAHTRIRGLLSQSFTARMVERLRASVVEITDELLEPVLEAGRGDLLESLAYPLPVAVISRLLGVPAGDFGVFHGWATAIVRGLDPALLVQEDVVRVLGEARRQFSDYFLELARHRRTDPQDDLLSAMVTVRDGEDRLTDVEVVATSTLLLIAGYETTANLIGNALLALMQHPQEWRRLRDRGEVRPADVDEFLRYDPPAQIAARVARQDVELDGVPIPKGHSVLALLGAANRDPAVYHDPDRFDLGRRTGRHLAFGQGIHLCLGRLLAHQEAQVAVERLTARTRTVELDGTELRWKPIVTLRALERLPVTVEAA
jgi:cytochrome P450